MPIAPAGMPLKNLIAFPAAALDRLNSESQKFIQSSQLSFEF
jgi:hypothetical protein